EHFHATGAEARFDDEVGLAGQMPAEMMRQQLAVEIEAAAGAVADENRDRLALEIGSAGDRHAEHSQDDRDKQASQYAHHRPSRLRSRPWLDDSTRGRGGVDEDAEPARCEAWHRGPPALELGPPSPKTRGPVFPWASIAASSACPMSANRPCSTR